MNAVIVPVHNDGQLLRRSLESILPSVKQYGWELIVVDDKSTDNSAKIAEEFTDKVIRLKENRGVAFARNTGAKSTDARILVFVDADIEVGPQTLKALVGALEKDPNMHTAGAWPLAVDLSPRWSAHFVGLRSSWGFQWSKGQTRRLFYPVQSECGAIRKSVFEELGGFPEQFGKVGMEEFKMGYELERRGYGCFLIREAPYKHYYKTLFRRSLILFERTMYWASLFLERKKFESPGAVGTGSAALSCLLSFVLFFCLILGLFIRPLWIAACASWLVQLIVEWPFLRFARKIYGWAMALYALFAIQAMHLFIGLGFIRGVIRFSKNRLF